MVRVERSSSAYGVSDAKAITGGMRLTNCIHYQPIPPSPAHPSLTLDLLTLWDLEPVTTLSLQVLTLLILHKRPTTHCHCQAAGEFGKEESLPIWHLKWMGGRKKSVDDGAGDALNFWRRSMTLICPSGQAKKAHPIVFGFRGQMGYNAGSDKRLAGGGMCGEENTGELLEAAA